MQFMKFDFGFDFLYVYLVRYPENVSPIAHQNLTQPINDRYMKNIQCQKALTNGFPFETVKGNQEVMQKRISPGAIPF